LKYMDKANPYRILIGGGGTGGHVFPALAIADAIRARLPGTEFLFVGAKGRLEMEKVPEAGYAIEGLPVAGFQRRLTLKNLTFFMKLVASMVVSRRIIRRFRPHLAIGVGGYASGPILKAASRAGIPVMLQEQNSCAGVTNRLLGRSARTICVAYEGMEQYFPSEKIILTGNPVRESLLRGNGDRATGLELFGLEEDRITCLVTGGSLGARTLNDGMAEGLSQLDRENVQVLWQCGKLYQAEMEEIVTRSGMKNIRVLPFISRMDIAYDLADVIVARAGAITISELCIIGKPVILVPSPNVAEDHQTRNAEALASRNAAIMIPDREARQKMVETMIGLAFDKQRRAVLSSNIKKLAIPDGSARIASEAINILGTA
jgi:UDP-N-acetylglucosamine--N-acetylmuramyl-(pentapeptide) pyrophosphoryl-undecaprenol N-acetylglucosamine transferase